MKKKLNRKVNSKKATVNVSAWLKRENQLERMALENASRHFDENDSLTVNTLEAIYGQESNFGKKRRKRGMVGTAGDFQLERKTARRMGLTVGVKNDQRFDLDDASAASAKYLKIQDEAFNKRTKLSEGVSTFPVEDSLERKKFTIAAYNAGEGRIARAQKLAKEDGKNPAVWEEVKLYLEMAGASPEKSKEIRNYVDKIIGYDMEFSKKSKADKDVKLGDPRKIKKLQPGGHWITIKGNHIFIEEK